MNKETKNRIIAEAKKESDVLREIKGRFDADSFDYGYRCGAVAEHQYLQAKLKEFFKTVQEVAGFIDSGVIAGSVRMSVILDKLNSL